MAPGQDEGPSQEASGQDVQQTPGPSPPPAYGQKFDRQQNQENPEGGETCTKSNPCCFELRIGVLVIGIVWIVGGVIELGLGCNALAVTLRLIVWEVLRLLADICCILSGIVTLGSGILLTFGVVKKNAQFVKISFFGCIAALVLYLFHVILMLAYWVPYLSSSIELTKTLAVGAVVGAIVGLVIVAAVTAYALLVIWAYMKQMTRTGQQVENMGGESQFPVAPPRPVSEQQSEASTMQ